MDNEKFQELMLDQFAKLFKEVQDFKKDVNAEFAGMKSEFIGMKAEFSGMKAELSDLKCSQIRMENKFDEQIKALHDFRVGQEQFNQEIKDTLTTLATKVEEIQFHARETDEKLEHISDDVNYLARRSLWQEKQLKGMKGV